MLLFLAKAAFGDLDTSEGRRLRKRSSEPVKVEEKKPTPKRSSSRVPKYKILFFVVYYCDLDSYVVTVFAP